MTGDSYLDSQSCEVTPEQAARRVMTWGDAYAYINNKDMINGNIGRHHPRRWICQPVRWTGTDGGWTDRGYV